MICRECLAVLGWQFVKDELRREVILGDMGFHAREGDPSNLKLGERGQWNERMMVETVLSMLTLVCHLLKRIPNRTQPGKFEVMGKDILWEQRAEATTI